MQRNMQWHMYNVPALLPPPFCGPASSQRSRILKETLLLEPFFTAIQSTNTATAPLKKIGAYDGTHKIPEAI